jgi:alkanesulfonate monooxygenase SsuD/methylene tetrahydromethanopterin reductase-like flavin-dependent oxidoreductase (luciferase family)
MMVGVWMPTAMPFELERSFFLDWVRLADQAGFDTLSSLDRPSYDMWDPLASLAAAAAVTQRIRLATTTLPLPSWGTGTKRVPRSVGQRHQAPSGALSN